MAPDSPAFRSIEARGLYKDYGRQRALAGVSMRLAAGQITTLLGENGAGKSTLLSILAGITRPSRGDVRFDDRPFSDVEASDFRRALGVLSHEPRCYADLSPRENLRLFGRLYALDAGQDLDTLVSDWLGRVGLERAADRPARQLSRGMMQRLALARTLLHRPQLLLLDEPHTGLDQAGAALLASLLGAERQRGALVVVVSHDLPAVAPLSDQVLVLSRGKLAAEQSFGFGSCTGESMRALYDQATKPSAAGRAS